MHKAGGVSFLLTLAQSVAGYALSVSDHPLASKILWVTAGVTALIGFALWFWPTKQQDPASAKVARQEGGQGNVQLQAETLTVHGGISVVNAAPPVAEPSDTTERDVDLTPSALMGYLKGQTSIQAQKDIEPLKGKAMRVSGSVSNVAPIHNGVSVSFEGHRRTLLLMFFEKGTAAEKAAGLRQGTYITVRGNIYSVEQLGVTLDGCEIEHVGPYLPWLLDFEWAGDLRIEGLDGVWIEPSSRNGPEETPYLCKVWPPGADAPVLADERTAASALGYDLPRRLQAAYLYPHPSIFKDPPPLPLEDGIYKVECWAKSKEGPGHILLVTANFEIRKGRLEL